MEKPQGERKMTDEKKVEKIEKKVEEQVETKVTTEDVQKVLQEKLDNQAGYWARLVQQGKMTEEQLTYLIDKTLEDSEVKLKVQKDYEELTARVAEIELSAARDKTQAALGLSNEDMELVYGNTIEEVVTNATKLAKRLEGVAEKIREEAPAHITSLPTYSGGTSKSDLEKDADAYDKYVASKKR